MTFTPTCVFGIKPDSALIGFDRASSPIFLRFWWSYCQNSRFEMAKFRLELARRYQRPCQNERIHSLFAHFGKILGTILPRRTSPLPNGLNGWHANSFQQRPSSSTALQWEVGLPWTPNSRK